MKTRVELLSLTGEKEKLLPFASVVSFSLKMGGGTAQIVIPKESADSVVILQKWKRIAISLWDFNEQKYKRAFVGIIEADTEEGGSYKLGLVSLQELFKRRFFSQTFSGQGGTLASTFLSQINEEKETGIVHGVCDVTNTCNLTEENSSASSILDNIAKATNAEWDISANQIFSFVSLLGTDKSSSIIIRHKANEQNSSILSSFKFTTEGKRIANRITVKNSNGLSVTVNDTASQNTYGLIYDSPILFESANDLPTLTAIANNLLPQKKDELVDIVVSLLPLETYTNMAGKTRRVGIGFFDVSLGDFVRVVLDDGVRKIDETRRILEISVRIAQNGIEETDLILSKSGAKQTTFSAISGVKEKEEILQRIRSLESLL
jgi:hypothetical protein